MSEPLETEEEIIQKIERAVDCEVASDTIQRYFQMFPDGIYINVETHVALTKEEIGAGYIKFLRYVLHTHSIDAAKQSVERIKALHDYFERIGDRQGQHYSMILALTGKNRARWRGDSEIAKIFSDWLVTV